MLLDPSRLYSLIHPQLTVEEKSDTLKDGALNSP